MGMQGWRKSMEDAHIAQLDMPGGISVFGVFDGHGGKSSSESTHISLRCYWYVETQVGSNRELIVACRLGGGSVCEGAFLQGVRETKVVLEQVLQGSAGRVFL